MLISKNISGRVAMEDVVVATEANALLGDPMLSEILVSMAGDACSLLIGRGARALKDVLPIGDRQADVLEAWQQDSDSFSPSLAMIASLPALENASAYRDALQSPAAATVIRQIVATVLVGNFPGNRDSLVKLMIQAMSSAARNSEAISPDAAAGIVDASAALASERFRSTKTTPETAALTEQLARTTLLQATIDSIRLEMGELASSAARKRDDDAEWLLRYRSQCSRRHGMITPPDNNKRTPVPIESIYVPGRIARPDLYDEANESVYDLIAELDRHVILGDPGGGKSTAANAIAYRVSSSNSETVPFVVVLRDYAAKMGEESIAAYVERTVSARYELPAPPAGLVEILLREGRAVVLLDGLDELLDPSKRRLMSEKVELFSSSYPSTRIMVTSRRVGYEEAALDAGVFQVRELARYTDGDIKEYVEKWFALNARQLQAQEAGTPLEDVVKAFLDESESIRDLSSNPLLLALLCIIYRGQNYLPRNRIDIYEKCTELLFETWDRSRGLVFNFAFEGYIDGALKHLAFWMFTSASHDEGVTEARLIREIETFFGQAYESPDRARTAAKEFIGFCKGRAWVLTETGLTPDGEPLFSFAHRTFLEYYAASQLTRKCSEPPKLARELVKHVARNEWDTVGQLAIQIINRNVERGAERTIEKMVRSSQSANRTLEYRANVLMFVVRCLVDLPPAPGLLRMIFESLSALVEALFATANSRVMSPRVSGTVFSLFKQDTSGERTLLGALEDYVSDAKLRGESGYFASLFITENALDSVDDAAGVFRKLFIDGDDPISERALQVSYYIGLLSVEEIAQLSTRQGGAPLDPWIPSSQWRTWDLSVNEPSYAFMIVHFDRIFPQGFHDKFRDDERWLGSLLRDIGLYVETSPPQPLATVAPLIVGPLHHYKRSTTTTDSDQEIGARTLAAVLAEMLIEIGTPVEETQQHAPAVYEAWNAYSNGTWGDLLDPLPESTAKRRLIAWASGDVRLTR